MSSIRPESPGGETTKPTPERRRPPSASGVRAQASHSGAAAPHKAPAATAIRKTTGTDTASVPSATLRASAMTSCGEGLPLLRFPMLYVLVVAQLGSIITQNRLKRHFGCWCNHFKYGNKCGHFTSPGGTGAAYQFAADGPACFVAPSAHGQRSRHPR
ncbi:conserved hypothetical protein [Ricinus communis]|uniref:Uncharacterized protein n=1 Tax=Ricinus communis TaxID=3988 RepID=B9T9B1_RICCO|nr:conserved hypothetical protein [Ricinus communis]